MLAVVGEAEHGDEEELVLELALALEGAVLHDLHGGHGGEPRKKGLKPPWSRRQERDNEPVAWRRAE